MAFFLPVFKQLNAADVHYVVVGGRATMLHGYVRAATDIDPIVDLQIDEAEKAIDTLSSEGYTPRIPVRAMEFAIIITRKQWIETKGMTVFSMSHPAQPGLSIDSFAQHPIPLDELWERSQVFDVDGTGIVCSLDDLIKLKQLTGPNKDLDDIAKLLKTMDHGK